MSKMTIGKLAEFMHEKAIEHAGKCKVEGQEWKPYWMLSSEVKQKYVYVAREILKKFNGKV